MYNSNLLFLVFFWLYFIASSFVINYLFYVRVQPELVLIPTGRILSVKWETIYPKALCIRSKLIRQREPFLIDVFFMHFDHMICGTDKDRRYHGPILVLDNPDMLVQWAQQKEGYHHSHKLTARRSQISGR